MIFRNEKNQSSHEEIQKVLEERELWFAKRLNLSCPKPKFFNCQVAADCKILMKGKKCNTCKISHYYSLVNCSKNWRCDAYVHREEIWQFVSKKYYAIYIAKKGKFRGSRILPTVTDYPYSFTRLPPGATTWKNVRYPSLSGYDQFIGVALYLTPDSLILHVSCRYLRHTYTTYKQYASEEIGLKPPKHRQFLWQICRKLMLGGAKLSQKRAI